MDEDTNYPFASYINGFVDGLKYASEEENNNSETTVLDSSTAGVAPPVVAPPVVARPVVVAQKSPEGTDPPDPPGALSAESFINNTKNLIEKFKSNKMESNKMEHFEAPVATVPTVPTVPRVPTGTTTAKPDDGNKKLYLWIMLVFLIGLLIYIIKLSANPVTGFTYS